MKKSRNPLEIAEAAEKYASAGYTNAEVIEVCKRLAEYEKQEPIGRVDRGAATDSNEYPDARVVCLHEHVGWEAFEDGCELFTRPVRAVNEWQKDAERMAKLHGLSFVMFREGEEPQCADPTKVRIEFTDKGLGYKESK